MIQYNRKEEIGKLRERLLIETVSETVNAYGERVETWATLATVWCGVEYRLLTSDEREETAKKTAIGEVVFTIRSRDDFDEKSRLTYRSTVYDIQAIEEATDRMYMKLAAKKRV